MSISAKLFSAPRLWATLRLEPVILGWEDKYDTWYLLTGGSHFGKISKVLEYLESMSPEQDNDLVLMIDAFDIWFQLPPQTLIERYYSINERANKRISEHMGEAAEIGNIKQTIVFGAGKRCAPNQHHTITCYPVPVSPVHDGIYGANTDTVMGRNRWTSNRQRYLNSGYIIGPAKDMRTMFKTVWEKAQNWQKAHHSDNGSGSSDLAYHASAQAVFAVVSGEQEYQREVMRRRHASSWTGQHKNQAPVNKIEGTEIGDVLNPPFTHEKMEPLEGRPCEYGIGLDYFSSLYTNICMDTIPVMPHFNGQKDARERQWSLFWVQQYGKSLVENSQRLRGRQIGASIWKKNERTQFIGWDALCPANYTEELFRGSDLSLVR